jgi:uncharacterized protein YnzC (UPF0291/DUF896 family)
MQEIKIERINQLAKKAKTIGLTEDELIEQKTLRQEYIQAFKKDLKGTLDSIIITDGKGNNTPLKRRN